MSLQDVLKAVQDSYAFKKTATVKGIPYGIKVLNVDQEKLVNVAVSALNEEDPAAYIRELRKEILSRAIIEIQGEPVPEVVEVQEGKKDKAIFLKEFFGTLPDTVIEKLFDAYVDLREESQKAIENEMQYDWFKTPEQRQKEYEEAADESKNQSDQSGESSEESEKAEKSEEEKLEDIKLRPVREEEPEIPSAAQE